MTKHQTSFPQDPPVRLDGIIKLAIVAVGGQGGGVLTNWIEAVARAQMYACQATSVAGVAQRTGATIYYIEMAPPGDAAPVFSLAPSAGDVDILIAAEMMEAGRAVMRGFVTPDRTTLIASTHRALAVSEKTVPGDGVASADEVRAAAEIAAQRLVMADFDRTATENGSVISSSLLGALAATGSLPFERQAFEDAIRAGGKGVEASLRAFGAAYDITQGVTSQTQSPAAAPGKLVAKGPEGLLSDWRELEKRIADWPQPVQAMAQAGLHKVVDFQDTAYGHVYLDKVAAILAKDDAGHDHVATFEAAKYIANAMAYDDVIRVADLKTRRRRFERIGRQMELENDQQMRLTEFFHPRAEEIAGLLPAALGARIEASPKWMAALTRWFDKGRRLRSDRLHHFAMLYFLGGRRKWRLKTLRHAHEERHLKSWLDTTTNLMARDYELAVEVIRCRRLIKGYSDTHVRGLSKFDRVITAAIKLAGRDDAAEWVRRLREAALQDEAGSALDGALKTVNSFIDV